MAQLWLSGPRSNIGMTSSFPFARMAMPQEEPELTPEGQL